jgi:uncharacterized membrane protein YbhN (UPF0104 family)
VSNAFVDRLRGWVRNRRVFVTIELIGLAVLLGALGWALRDVWGDAAPRLRHADVSDLVLAVAIVAGYYLAFVLGWIRILAAYEIRIPYRVALRRFGVRETPVVLASILLEAGLSAVAGVGVFLVGLVIIGGADVPLLPLGAFGLLVSFLLYPPVFANVAGRLLRPFGAQDVAPLPARTAFELIGFYALTWPLGGAAMYFMLRSVGGDPALSSIPFLGGVSAVGAIVAVLAVFAPSGLGVREASMYGLLLAVVGEAVALGTIVINRLAITVVEAALLLVGVLLLRRRRVSSGPRRAAEGAADA